MRESKAEERDLRERGRSGRGVAAKRLGEPVGCLGFEEVQPVWCWRARLGGPPGRTLGLLGSLSHSNPFYSVAIFRIVLALESI